MKRMLALALLFAMLFVLVPARAADLPEEVLAIVEVPSIRAMQEHLEAYVGAALPSLYMGDAQVAFARTVARTDPEAIDAGRPARMLALKGQGARIDAVFVFGVTSAEAYLEGLRSAMNEQSREGDVTLFGTEATGRPGTAPRTLAVAVEGRVVCVGRAKDAVRTALEMVRGRGLTNEPILEDGADMAAHVRLRALLDHLAGEKGSAFWRLRERFELDLAQADRPEQLEQARVMLPAQLDVAEALGAQVESATAAWTADAQHFRLTLGLEAAPDTPLAAYLASVPKGALETLGLLPADAGLVMAVRMGDYSELVEWSMKFWEQIEEAAGSDPPARAARMKQMREAARLRTEETAFSVGIADGFRMIELERYETPESAKQSLSKAAEIMSGLNALYEQMAVPVKIEVSPAAFQYKGHDITEGTFDFTVPAEIEARVMEMIFGEDKTFYFAAIGNDSISAMGNGALEALKQLIDGDYEKVTDSAEFQKALSLLGPDPNGVFYLRLATLVPQAMALAARTVPVPIPVPEVRPGPGIIGGVWTAGKRVQCRIVAPSEELRILADGFTRAAQEEWETEDAGGELEEEVEAPEEP